MNRSYRTNRNTLIN